MSPLPAARTTIAVGTVVRLVLAAVTGLGIDESYALAVNRPVSWSYFDHPPLVFWLSAAAEALAGARHPLVVRLPFILIFALTLSVLASATRWSFGDAAARAAVLVASVAGVIGVTGATWVLPDGPMFLGMIIGAAGAVRALVPSADGSPGDPSGWWWVGVGAGLAALAKYHAIFLPIGLLVYLVTTRNLGVLASWRPWAAAAIAAVFAAPVIAWNAAHDWASFRFQGSRAAPTGAWSPAPFLENVAGQAVWILPWVWGLVMFAAWRIVRRGVRTDAAWLWCCLGLGPIVAFTGSALLGRRGLPHWQAPGYLLLTPLAGLLLATALANGRRWAQRWVWWAPAATGATAMLLATQTAIGWLDLPPARDPTRDAVPWDRAA
ncbi:MAG: glycosyltransferase family 39 protein, partial [Gemmatimonadaceae bacterium]|nr:glycosyltransferase family 39 protein [Gemmatimonadaceae bacterium]